MTDTKNNTGDRNTSHWNSGYWNTGDGKVVEIDGRKYRLKLAE